MKGIVILTGASGGIGSAVAERLISENYHVVGLDCVENESLKASKFLKVDLADTLEVEHTCRRIIDRWPHLWAIVHCAGIYPIRNWGEYEQETWDNVLAVNLTSVFQVTQALYKNVELGGRIVVVSSGAGHIGSRDVGYSASKAGVLGLVRSLARVLGPQRILVNAVCPGVIETDMSARTGEQNLEEYQARIPLGRLGSALEVAACISFLLSRDNSYMTGATLDVNGGLYAR